MPSISSDPRFLHLCELAVSILKTEPIPGAAFAVYYQGQTHLASLGVTSVDHPLPVTPDTLFQVGSITKTFTATAILRLVEMGRLDLDIPIRTYLPSLRLADESVARRVTIRHLLTHTGGWVGDYFNDYGPDSGSLARIIEERKLSGSLLGSTAIACPPGVIHGFQNESLEPVYFQVMLGKGRPEARRRIQQA